MRRLSRQQIFEIVAAVNSAGDTLTRLEAKDLVVACGGQAGWVDHPPDWVAAINEELRRRHQAVEEAGE